MRNTLPEGTLTLLVSDTVGSTALIEQVGDEAAQRRIREHRSIARSCADRREGVEVDSAGDGMLIAFNAAGQGVDCALEIQRRHAQHNFLHPDRAVQVRIGLTSGDAGRGPDGLYGRVVNAAARICARAAGGEILASRVVRELVSADCEARFEPRGEVALKGFSAPWELFEIEEPKRGIQGSLASSLAGELPFVAREAELSAACRLVDEAYDGRGGLLLLAGESGVGKTRLAQETAAYASGRGLRVVIGHAYEAGGAPAYSAFAEVVEALVGRDLGSGDLAPGVEAEWLTRLLRGHPEAARPGTASLSPEHERHLIFESVSSLLRDSASKTPLLLVLENLHWADPSTLLLLRHVARGLEDAAIGVIGTYTDTDLDRTHPLLDTVVELMRAPNAGELCLLGLERDEIHRLLWAMTDSEPPAAIAAAVFDETEGVPFTVEQIVKFLLEEGRLVDADEGWSRRLQIGMTDVPHGVKLVVNRRLRRLGPASLEMLDVAAVSGRVFTPKLLADVLGNAGEPLGSRLDECLRARVIREAGGDGEDAFGFVHELIRQVLYTQIMAPRRRQLHLGVADSLAGRTSTAEPVAELAYHYHHAGDEAPAGLRERYSGLAGDEAMQASAFEDAAEHYRRGLEACAGQKAKQAELECRLGAAQSSSGEWDVAAETLERARRLFAEAGLPEGVERTCHQLTLLQGWRGDYAEALRCAREGLAADPGSARPERAQLLSLSGLALSLGGGPEPDGSLFEQARGIAEGDDGLLGDVLTSQGFHEWVHLDPARACETLASGEALLRKAGNLSGLSQTLVAMIPPLLYLGRFPESAVRVLELGPLSQRLGDAGSGAMYRLFLGGGAVMRGDLDRAERDATRARELAESRARVVVPQTLELRSHIEALRGRPDRAEEWLLRAIDAYEGLGRPNSTYVGWISLLALHAEHGDPSDAERILAGNTPPEPLGDDGDSGTPTIAVASQQAGAAMSLCYLGRAEQAARYYPWLARLAGQGFVSTPQIQMPNLQRLLGMLAGQDRRWDAAAQHYEAALSFADSIAMQVEIAETCFWYGSMFAERGADDDLRRARQLLERAVELRRKQGMLAGRAEDRLRQLGGSPSP